MRSDRKWTRARILWPIVVVACIGIGIPAQAYLRKHASGASPSVSSANYPLALDHPLRAGFTVVREFSAVSHLSGWVLRGPHGRYHIVYTTPDGHTLISGRVLTAAGVNLTARYTALYAPKLNLDALWHEFATQGTVIVAGARHPKSIIYVIMDPNCIFCHMLWIALRRYEAVGLQVRWIPVGFLHKDSPAKAAALLKGGNPVLTAMQEKFNVRRESGGVPGIPITPKLKAELAANMALMHAGHVMGTPGIFYRDAAGHVHFKDGMPLLSELPAITGLPAQKENAPILAQFAH